MSLFKPTMKLQLGCLTSAFSVGQIQLEKTAKLCEIQSETSKI
jgi:hypothetical protein